MDPRTGRPVKGADIDARARQKVARQRRYHHHGPSHWQHRLEGFEYNHRTLNEDDVADRGCDPAVFNFADCFFLDANARTVAGFFYQG